MKLKLTDSPGIAGGFYWIHQKKPEILKSEFQAFLLCNQLFIAMQNMVYDTNNLAAFQIYTRYSLCDNTS